MVKTKSKVSQERAREGGQKDRTGASYTDWYALWMQQSKAFFESANENLHSMFADGEALDPEQHMAQIQSWLAQLKKQWQSSMPKSEEKNESNYFQMMAQMMNDASNMLLEQWMKINQSEEPIKNVHDLYALWLNCCHKAYQQYAHTRSFQEAYGEFMNDIFKFWKINQP